MNFKAIIKKILSFSDNTEEITKVIIKVYLDIKQIDYNDCTFFEKYLDNINYQIYEEIIKLFKENLNNIDIYTLINLFELLLDKEEIKEFGAVYTPQEVKKFIINKLIGKDNINIDTKIIDPACGCGSILISLAEYINDTQNITYETIFKNILYGIDINSKSIFKAELLSRIIALENREILPEKFEFNYICDNSLDNDILRKLNVNSFNYVIANPPYVRSKNISLKIKESLKNFNTSKIGNVDLYIPFFELGLKIVEEKGKIGYITPNTYLKSVNGRGLRNYLLNYDKLKINIFDFNNLKVFKNALNYTCVTIIEKNTESWELKYKIIDESFEDEKIKFSVFDKEILRNKSEWKLNNNDVYANIIKMESFATKLGDYNIKNGLATLKNDLYFFNIIKEDQNYYYRIYNDKEYKIEKNICINIIKPNILKKDVDLNEKMEKGIFPYKIKDNRYEVIDEKEMILNFPKAYEFLKEYEKELQNRDKGNGKYPVWYAYGRTQGMNNFGKKLLIPYIADKPYSVIAEQKNLLFYCGYALFDEKTENLKVLKKIIESDIFNYYIKNSSKPYSNGYMSYAKNYIKNFSIPKLTNEDREYIIRETDTVKLNKFISDLYDINIYNK